MSFVLSVVLAAGIVGPLDRTIVSPAWLEQNLENPAVVLVEVGSSPAADHPHIPGAHYLRINAIVNAEGWPPDEMPPVEQLRRAFENAGIGDDGRIVIYSANPLFATRAWLTLDSLGQGDRAAILDGGFGRWTAEKRPISSKRLPRLPKTFTPRPDPTRLISLAGVRAVVDSGAAVLIDARSAYDYHGFRRGRSVVRRGHIPGARSLHWQTNLRGDGSYLPAADLQAMYGNVTQKPDARVIVYCRTGMEASMPYFILRSLGYDVVLYDGSFAEWARDKTTVVEKRSPRT